MDVNAPELDWLVSVDDHVIEPANVWVDRASAKYRDDVPASDRRQVGVRREDGRHLRSLGHDREAQGGVHAEPGAVLGDARGRVRPRRSPRGHGPRRDPRIVVLPVVPALLRPGVLGGAGQGTRAAHCVQSYNDWMIDEWCGTAPGRYIPLIIIPLWDPAAAAVEMERCAAKGATAFAFSENPEPLGLPTIHDPNRYWDPVLAAAQDLQMVVCMHVGSSSTMPTISSDAPGLANLTFGAVRAAGTMLAWLFSDVFERMPGREDRAVGGQHRLDAVLHRASRAGHRQATALGEERRHRVLRQQGRRPSR